MSADEARAEREKAASEYSHQDRFMQYRTPMERMSYEHHYKAGWDGHAEWQASRPFTEEDVEAVAKVIYENERESIDGARDWPAWDDCREESRKSVLDAARAALAAVTKRRQV